jgi:hypothetical protein
MQRQEMFYINHVEVINGRYIQVTRKPLQFIVEKDVSNGGFLTKATWSIKDLPVEDEGVAKKLSKAKGV